jgi:hypothetical protein
MTEEWRDVRSYEGLYQVSDLGRVRRIGAGRGATAGRVLKQKPPTHKCDYLRVQLCKNDVKRTVIVHALVAEAFIGRRPRGKHVNHKNLDKLDNRFVNIEWVTRRQNAQHALQAGRVGGRAMPGARNGRAKLTESQVAEIRKQRGRIGQRVLAILCGVSKTAIQLIHQGKHWPEDLRVREFPRCQ